MFPSVNPDPVMPAEDELVEDAGLYDQEQIKLQREEDIGSTTTAKIGNR